MGFAWSSFVAQSTLLACCRGGGFSDSICMSDERPIPSDAIEAYALATDDVMHFSKVGPDLSRKRMVELDEALLESGVETSCQG